MDRKVLINGAVLTPEKEIEIHASMGAQLLPYMTPEDAFEVVARYIESLRTEYNTGADVLSNKREHKERTRATRN